MDQAPQQEVTTEQPELIVAAQPQPKLHPVVQLALAVASKARFENERYRGIDPRGTGTRAYARRCGYDNMAHMRRILAAQQVMQMRARGVPEEKIAEVLSQWNTAPAGDQPPATCTAKQAEQAEWNAKVQRRNQRYVHHKASLRGDY